MDTPIFSRRNPRPRKPRASTLTIPERVGPHVKLVFAEMKRQGYRYDDVEDGSGVLRTTIKAWRGKNYPNLDSIEAVLGFLGWRFVPIPAERALPPEIVAELRPLAERLGLEMPIAFAALVDIVAAIRASFPADAPPPLAAQPEVLVPAGTLDHRAAA